MQRVEEATKTAPVVGLADRIAAAIKAAAEEATKTVGATVETVAGLEPSQRVEEATKTVGATVAGLAELRRRDEATFCRAHALQEFAMPPVPVRPVIPDPACQPTLTIPEAAAFLRIGRSKAYDLAARGLFPVPLLQLDGDWRVPTRPLLRLLGLLDEPGEPESGETSERTGPIAAAQDQETRQSA